MRDLKTRPVSVGDISLAVTETGEGPAVLFIHGFPELGYSWRRQLPSLAAAGFRAIAPDMRGYGGSSKPDGVEAYDLAKLVGDVIGLLDELEVDRAHLVGHDWGSVVAMTTAIEHPDRVTTLTNLNVPYRGWCGGFPSLSNLDDESRRRFSYILRFQELGAEEARFEADPDLWLKTIYLGFSANTEFMNDEDFGVYREAFVAGGVAGPLGWYRNIDDNAVAFAHRANAPIEVPMLMITADYDPVLPASLADGMERWVEDLEVVAVTGSGHWTQQEQPDQVNAALVGFLGRH
jgi:pimeloyl-ACP methyl ester carboxylesterase